MLTDNEVWNMIEQLNEIFIGVNEVEEFKLDKLEPCKSEILVQLNKLESILQTVSIKE